MKIKRNYFFFARFFFALLFFFTAASVSSCGRHKNLPPSVPENGGADETSSEQEKDESDNFDGIPAYPTAADIKKIDSFYLLRQLLFMIDDSAYVTAEDLNVGLMLETSFTADLAGPEPKVLIFHTHSHETYASSHEEKGCDVIVIGKLLAETLRDEYGINTLHDTTRYDVSYDAYERMEEGVWALLAQYPSIEVTIDLHRDGVPDGVRLITEANGRQTARIMFVTGVSKLNRDGSPETLDDYPNPYVFDNIALALQLQLTANEMYPGLMRRINIKPYRYSLHFTRKSLLVEIGAQNNTAEEARSAVGPLARVLYAVLAETAGID